jgi:hypothetical protein
LTTAGTESRVVFAVDCSREEQTTVAVRLHESSVFTAVTTVGSVEHE